MVKKSFLFFTILIILFLFVGCSAMSASSEDKIKNDLEVNSNMYFSNTEVIEKVEVLKRNTDKESKVDYVWCKVDSKDDEVAYVKYFLLYYALYDDSGWVLQNIESDNLKQWTSTPLVGVNLDLINSSLIGLNLKVNDDMWEVTSDNIDSITIVSQDTKVEEKKDSVIATVNLISDVQTAQGELTLEYVYNKGWMMNNFNISKDFVSSYKSNASLKLEDEDLISTLTKKTMVLGEDYTEQLISINKEEIYDFSRGDIISQEKGTIQMVDCNFKLDKKVVVFSVNAKITYVYDKASSWDVSDITFSPKIDSIDIEGEWVGQYETNGGTKLILNISKVAADGSITAIFNFSALPTNPSIPSGSYRMIGGIDFNNLRVVLEGKEWIEQPDRYNFIDLDGCLHIDDVAISSKRGTRFEVKK